MALGSLYTVSRSLSAILLLARVKEAIAPFSKPAPKSNPISCITFEGDAIPNTFLTSVIMPEKAFITLLNNPLPSENLLRND